MKIYLAREVPCEMLLSQVSRNEVYPYIKDDKGDKSIYCISPIHGRSFIIGQKGNGKWIVCKGNGLSYTTHSFVDVSEYDTYIWGALSKDNAIRDYNICKEVHGLGIKTNLMNAVLELGIQLIDKETSMNPCLLQYEVECPYRLSDYPFMSHAIQMKVIESWYQMGSKYSELYLIAADILVRNLHILHKNNILHNALHVQNYTWSLELVDFESSRTDNYPYSNYEYERNVMMLKNGEIMKTYEIINYIGWCIGEVLDYVKIERIFNKYGFDLEQFRINYK